MSLVDISAQSQIYDGFAMKTAEPAPSLPDTRNKAMRQVMQKVGDPLPEARQAKHANPKKAFGDKKPPLSYFPMAGLLAGLEALYDGRLKYEPFNWRDDPVEAMTYVDAAFRHLKLFSVGEEITRDTLVNNLGAVIACCTIILDAQAHGSLIDNRRHSKVDADLLHEAEAWVARLKAKQAEREQERLGGRQWLIRPTAGRSP